MHALKTETESNLIFISDSLLDWAYFLIPAPSLIQPLSISRHGNNSIPGIYARLVFAEVRCQDYDEDTFEPLDDDKLYNIVTLNYLLNGGGGYTMLQENIESRVTGELNREVIREVLETSGPVSAKMLSHRPWLVLNKFHIH